VVVVTVAGSGPVARWPSGAEVEVVVVAFSVFGVLLPCLPGRLGGAMGGGVRFGGSWSPS
jgi:hypothetical protein